MEAGEIQTEQAGATRFSVVIPVYNGAATIGRAIDSVLAQTHPAAEVIVVDDGSTDATREVVTAYGKRVRYTHQANTGPSAARNKGVSDATGDWIAFLDADDWYYPERLRVHAEMIERTPDLDFLVGNFDYRDAHGALLYQSMSEPELGKRLLAQHGPFGQAILREPELVEFISAQFSDLRTLSLPRHTFLASGGFATDLMICEDVVFLLRLCARSRRVGVSCRPLAAYVVHAHGLIRSDRFRAQTETIRALRTLREEAKQFPAPLRDAWRSLVKKAYLNLAFYHAKKGERGRAAASVARSLQFHPTLGDLKTMVSVLRG